LGYLMIHIAASLFGLRGGGRVRVER
jgi:hypothetical protein